MNAELRSLILLRRDAWRDMQAAEFLWWIGFRDSENKRDVIATTRIWEAACDAIDRVKNGCE